MEDEPPVAVDAEPPVAAPPQRYDAPPPADATDRERARVVDLLGPTAVPVDGERRLYAVRGSDPVELVYATELAPAGEAYAAHLNGRLTGSAASLPDPG